MLADSSQDSAVGIPTGYVLNAKGSEFESRWGQDFSLLRAIRTISEAHPTSYPLDTEGSFSGGRTGSV
jgi:hypothetical protein